MLFPFLFPFLFFHESFCFDLLLSFFWQKMMVLMIPEVRTDEAVTDLIVASEEEPRDSEVDPESPPGMTSLLLFFFFFFSTAAC